MGRPVILVDHEYNCGRRRDACSATTTGGASGSTRSPRSSSTTRRPRRSGACRRFRGPAFPAGPAVESRSIPELMASAKAFRNYARRDALAPGRIWPGRSSGSAWTMPGASSRRPDSVDGWKMLGQIELCREPAPTSARGFGSPSTRSSICRSSGRPMPCGTRWELAPSDFTTLLDAQPVAMSSG